MFQLDIARIKIKDASLGHVLPVAAFEPLEVSFLLD